MSGGVHAGQRGRTSDFVNDVQHRLPSDVWTQNIGRAHRVTAGIQASTWRCEVFLEPRPAAVSLGTHHMPHGVV